MCPTHTGSLYEHLVIAIVLQNATVRRSAQMLQALFERYGIATWARTQPLARLRVPRPIAWPELRWMLLRGAWWRGATIQDWLAAAVTMIVSATAAGSSKNGT